MYLVTEWIDNNEGSWEKGEIFLFKDLERAKLWVERHYGNDETYGIGYDSFYEWSNHNEGCFEYNHVINYKGKIGRVPMAAINVVFFED